MIPIGICTDFTNLPDAHALGYDFMEIPLDALSALSDAYFEEFAAWCTGSGVRVQAVNHMLPEGLSIVGPDVRAPELHAYLSRAFARCQRLSVRVVTLDAALGRTVPEGFDYPMAWRQLGNFLRLCQGHAKECGIAVCLEPLRKADCSLLNLVSEATLIAGLLQLNNIAVAAHWGHMSMASEPMNALWRAAPLLGHVHLENALTRRLPAPGDGEDYGRMLSPLNTMGYKGGISLCGVTTETFVQDAAAAVEYIRKLNEELRMRN